MREISQALKGYALNSGADLVGLAPARPLPEAWAYHKWIAANRQGTMDYMAKNSPSREDITHWYPEAKSVLICGFNYADNKDRQSLPENGRIARYAALPDYHPELKKRMKSILEWFKTAAPGSEGRIFVDTSPLLERLYARYAGIGWVGKNTMLIAPKLGSYFFIAGIALNQDLDYDEPVPDHCGSCNRCLKACPTGAFPEPKVLDASRCIAYFTIEHRGKIPEQFRPKIGNWIMGCDLCQEACPWNRFALSGCVFQSGQTNIPLEEIAELSEEQFKARFGKTPLSRAKRRGILRNALLAMGNSRNPRFKPALKRYSENSDPLLSEQAAWSLPLS